MNKRKFDTIQEYIDYLIYDKNILNLKNICILIILLGTIAIGLLQFNKSQNSDYDWFEGGTVSIDNMKETLIQAGYSAEEINKLSDEEIDSLFTEMFVNIKGQTTGNNKYKEFPEQEASVLKNDYYLKASKGDFDFIVTDFEDKKIKYYFSKPYNKELITIYNDAYYLKTISNNTEDSFKIQQVLSNIKDPQMLLYGSLLTEEKYRRNTFIDKFSLSPILVKKQVTFSSIFSTSMLSISTIDNDNSKDSHFREMAQYVNDGNYIFYRIKFYIDNNPLTAYMYKNASDLKLTFYGVYSDDKNSPYLRVYDFIQMENTIANSYNTANNNNSNSNTNTNIGNKLENTNSDSSNNDNNSNNINNNVNISEEIEEIENIETTEEELNFD